MTRLDKTAQPSSRRLDRLAAMVDRALERVLPRTNVRPRIIHEAMRYCVFSGGKRFRPLLCLGACDAIGARVRKALPVACAIELIHTYSLVHDDLPAMDNAKERRGKPTCHRKFGEGNAILVGDALLTMAFDCLSRDGTPNVLAIMRTIGQACGTSGLIGGQVLDLQVLKGVLDSKAKALEDIARRKTAALITASVVAGGLAGCGSRVQLDRLAHYGRRIGLAFQLIDDVHDQDGLSRACGVELTRSKAKRLIADADNAIELFGSRAGLLHELASWLSKTI